MSLTSQIAWLLLLALPVASISWTVTHEEIFREFREYCQRRGPACSRLYARKFFYALTCEYCLSHYVAVAMIALTGFQLLVPDWRGYPLAAFAIVWIANLYMSLFGRLRLDLKSERLDIAREERALEDGDSQRR